MSYFRKTGQFHRVKMDYCFNKLSVAVGFTFVVEFRYLKFELGMV